MLAAVDCSDYGTCTSSDPIYAASYLAGFWTFYAVLTVVQIWVTVRITRKAGYSPWLGILGVLPIINFVAILVFAFKAWPVETELRELRGRLAMAQATAAAAGRSGAPTVSRFGTPPPPSGAGFGGAQPSPAPAVPGYGQPTSYGAAPAYAAPPPPVDPTAVYGGQPAYATQPSFTAPPAAPSRFGTPPPPEAPSRFGTPPPPQAPSRFGTPPPPAADAQQPPNPWQPPQQQPPQRW